MYQPIDTKNGNYISAFEKWSSYIFNIKFSIHNGLTTESKRLISPRKCIMTYVTAEVD